VQGVSEYKRAGGGGGWVSKGFMSFFLKVGLKMGLSLVVHILYGFLDLIAAL
jgi:hypothetical protein